MNWTESLGNCLVSRKPSICLNSEAAAAGMGIDKLAPIVIKPGTKAGAPALKAAGGVIAGLGFYAWDISQDNNTYSGANLLTAIGLTTEGAALGIGKHC